MRTLMCVSNAMKFYVLCCLFCFLFLPTVRAQDNKAGMIHEERKMEWFRDAKFGVFVHWGIYSVRGISESWSFYNNYINHENYMSQLNGFTASAYDATQWAALIEASGAKYSVITSKHHDGVSLWPSSAPRAITAVKDAAAKSDLLSPFVKALREKELKVGIYYSLPDWSHPDYDVFTRYRKRYELKDDATRWNRFIRYQQQQLRELGAAYHPDLMWFDGDWEHSDAEWRAPVIASILREENPDIVINSRLGSYGDYDTPEQGVPIVRPQASYWELCYTINDSWGYQPFDRKYKSANMLIRTLVDCIAMGGNLLLDIGPKADGSIPQEQVDVLKAIGKWTKKHQHAIYGTRAGLEGLDFNGRNALSKDGKTLYLYWEKHGVKNMAIRGLASRVLEAYVVSESNRPIAFKQEGGRLLLELPEHDEDEDVTVVALQLEEAARTVAADAMGQWPDEPIESIASEERANLQIDELIYRLNGGNNLLDQSGLTIDGLDFNISQISGISENSRFFEWIKKHAEALYKTGRALPKGHYNGYSALSADKMTLFLFVEGMPTGPIALKGLKNTVQRVRIVGEGSMIDYGLYNKLYWSNVPGLVYIDIPKDRLDNSMTVIAILLDKPLELYRESIQVIDDNK